MPTPKTGTLSLGEEKISEKIKKNEN